MSPFRRLRRTLFLAVTLQSAGVVLGMAFTRSELAWTITGVMWVCALGIGFYGLWVAFRVKPRRLLLPPWPSEDQPTKEYLDNQYNPRTPET